MSKRIALILISLTLVFALSSCYSPPLNSSKLSHNQPQEKVKKEFDYEYTNAKGQKFSFHGDDDSIVIYEKSVDELFKEWEDNVALAEKTYSRSDVMIITEGYVADIGKDEFEDCYYLLLSTSNEKSLFPLDSLKVYFKKQSAYEALLKTKKGDYLNLVCTAWGTSFVFEEPELEAVLILEPIKNPLESNGMEEFIGKTVSDIAAIYGKDYYIDEFSDMGSGIPYLAYNNCPYVFYYESEDGYSAEWPFEDDKIWGVGATLEGTHVTGSIYIGTTQEEIESYLGYAIELYEPFEGCGWYVADIILYGLNFQLNFDNDTSEKVLHTALCWINEDASESETIIQQDQNLSKAETSEVPVSHNSNAPKIIQENIDALVFGSYGDMDLVKKYFILSVMQDDMDCWGRGGISALGGIWDAHLVGPERQEFWIRLTNDLDMYIDGKPCEYEWIWDMLSSTFDQYVSGALGENAHQIAEVANSAFDHLGVLP